MARKRTPLMAGNWKMNLDHNEATERVQKLAWELDDAGYNHRDVEAAVLVPYTGLRSVQSLVRSEGLPLKHGAQDVSEFDSGAYTGDISAPMLHALGVQYCTVGHSERRTNHDESDQQVNAKIKALAKAGITAIVCIGEDLDVREAGNQVEFTLNSLRGSLEGLTPAEMEHVVIAYEPVWAIGTGKVATPDDAQEVIGAIRQELAKLFGDDVANQTRILYGGSVKAENVADIMAEPDIDGALVGGASLDPREFTKIITWETGTTKLEPAAGI